MNQTSEGLDLRPRIDKALQTRGYSLESPKALAHAVMQLSTYYRDHPAAQTPWREVWCQVAYLAYFLPLNYCRAKQAVSRGKEFDFFADYKHAIDFGSGLGSAELAMTAEGVGFDSMQFIETAHEAVNLHRALIETTGARLSWSTREPSTKDILPETLAIFSYSFTELKQLPKWVEACDGLMIVEPATQEDGRRLMELRQAWINLGWSVVAPCVHQEACPLLVHSGRDWCHDRVAWQRPDWIQAMEDYMPIKNGTLPYSYMLLRRKPLRSHYTQHGFKLARVTGDLQEFKGFAKQLICQSSEREFIAFQKRDFKKAYPNFPRGSLVSIKEGLEKKGHELRPKAEEMTSTILPKP